MASDDLLVTCPTNAAAGQLKQLSISSISYLEEPAWATLTQAECEVWDKYPQRHRRPVNMKLNARMHLGVLINLLPSSSEDEGQKPNITESNFCACVNSPSSSDYLSEKK